MEYGYCRISTKQQNLERQIRNIKKVFPNAVIIEEVYTGTKTNRPNFKKLINKVKQGDTIVFDSVSRMSRNAEEGYQLYEELYNRGVELIFLKEPLINTTTYKESLEGNIKMTGTDVDFILDGINKYMLALAKTQIKLAFEQSEKEVEDMRQRTREGIETARLNGKQIGGIKGVKLITKKSKKAKEEIRKYSQSFNGTLNNKDCMKLIGLSVNTFYKYKREMMEEFG